MSVVNPLEKLFLRKPVQGDADLGQPDIIQDSISAGVLSQAYQADGMPSVLGDYGDTVRKPEPGVAEQEQISLPLLGSASTGTHQRRLLILLGVGLVLLALIAGWALQQSSRSAKQLAAMGQSLMQSQRLAKSVSQALAGQPQAIADMKDSADVLARNLRALNAGDAELGVQALGESFKPELEAMNPLVERAERNAGLLLGQKAILTQVGEALRAINQQSPALLESAEGIAALKLQNAAPAADISAAG